MVNTHAAPGPSSSSSSARGNQDVFQVTPGQQVPGQAMIDADAEMGGGTAPADLPTLEQLVARLNNHIGNSDTSLNPGSYLPSFKKGTMTDRVAADILSKFVNKAAILLDKIRMAQKILREVNAKTQLGYWGHLTVNNNRVTLSKDVLATLSTSFDNLLVSAIKADKANIIQQCQSELNDTLPRQLADTLSSALVAVENNSHLNNLGKDFTYKLIRATAIEFSAQVQVLRATAEFQQLNLGLKNTKKDASKKKPSKPKPSRRQNDTNKYKGPKGPSMAKKDKKKGGPPTSSKKTTHVKKGKGPVKKAPSPQKQKK
ncbi:hypothetical protein BCR41DRAFT_353705 [Lobosporangium transversale]|uniref:Uncharacterized protein n=1 Tax=Lobosporangium transversale TaxID=64571 RepID=A0A1Y2GPU8_9FUNG|nr:hypothetical protein BCR41DRAFT_366335 [Lobosporangium transversale]XP_021875097.1 hypothetical protein BCR41DRAFT_365908 [Lobosporangium transversale]XP_021881549.1 hypothetical protein BCR41DRAFT_353705 [Lobosporangium transversale]ORY88373.1 hypothetical protein BCR41DRAFT_366335 [Lobosporangium transversale]ORY90327.1 hypothetical protein BCR41DRAFT_365908 [Lobosporangium transversale]ORZ16202.1 hypothetical protein BCR41DRAFT_353705 [Lobosporangium transversale]|eukprot:XP_021874993.1 hypothetical protein BCR41DRAFT_366335 [Lobosporangium transversale]